MKRILFFAAAASLLFAIIPGSAAQAQTKGAAKKAAMPYKLQKATIRRTLSPSEHEDVHTDILFVLAWKSNLHPKAIFYRPDASHWLKCKATRSEKRPFGGGPNDYMVVDMNTKVENIKAGDIVNLIPEEYPSDVQPDAIKSMPSGGLYYQLENSNAWKMDKVKLTKLPDLQHQ